jgi:hypothetical protein
LAQFKPQKSLTFAVQARCIKNEGFWDAILFLETAIHASSKTKHMNALKNLYQNRDPLRLAYGKASGTMRGVLFDRASVLEVETDFACFVPMTCRQAAV